MLGRLLPLIPPHHTYVEVFGGGAALLFNKEPSPVEVYNDIDGDLVNFFRVLRDPEKFQRFYQLVQLTPYSREEFEYCFDTLKDSTDDVERAYKFFVVARMSMSGMGVLGVRRWSYVISESYRGMSENVSKWLSVIERLPEFHARVMRVQIENDDFRRIIPRYDTKETLFYCDPPYVSETRGHVRYRCDMTVEDHKDLVELLLSARGMVLLSGYQHPVYAPLEDAGWTRLDFPTACYAVVRSRGSGLQGKGAARTKVPRVESVWINPKAWVRLEVAKADSLGIGRLEPIEPIAKTRGGNVADIIIEDRR